MEDHIAQHSDPPAEAFSSLGNNPTTQATLSMNTSHVLKDNFPQGAALEQKYSFPHSHQFFCPSNTRPRNDKHSPYYEREPGYN